jgi:hypothetical protein
MYVDTFGTFTVDEETIERALVQIVDLRPEAIIRHFNLRRPICSAIARYGAFGQDDLDLPWERTDIADKLRSLVRQLQVAVQSLDSFTTVNCEPPCTRYKGVHNSWGRDEGAKEGKVADVGGVASRRLENAGCLAESRVGQQEAKQSQSDLTLTYFCVSVDL